LGGTPRGVWSFGSWFCSSCRRLKVNLVPDLLKNARELNCCAELTLEELDQVFSVPTWKHASYQLKNGVWHVKKYVFFQRHQEPLEPFYQGAERMNTK
jgi:hypothetical protein